MAQAAQTVVVGSTRGIGRSLLDQLHRRGHSVLATSRASAQQVDGFETIEGVDIAKPKEAAQAVESGLSGRELGTLVLVSGILEKNNLGEESIMDEDSFMRQFRVNTVGPTLLCAKLVANGTIRAGSSICLVSSRAGCIGETSGDVYGYRASKAALNMCGANLAQDLLEKNIPVVLLHPGFVKTGMTQDVEGIDEYGITPDEAARDLAERIDSDVHMQNTGKFFHRSGFELPW